MRRVRELGVYSELVPCDAPEEAIRRLNPRGVILSGGPASVYEPGAPQMPAWLRDTGKEHTAESSMAKWYASEAAVEAARLRFRPIVMTSFAFILGVLPLVFAHGAGAASRQSLGTAVCGGMLTSTVLAVFFVPVFFVLMGMRTDLKSFAQPGVLTLAAVLCVVAVVGKLVSGFGVLASSAAAWRRKSRQACLLARRSRVSGNAV